MNDIVKVNNLVVRFEEFVAVNDISFSVGEGEVRGILGGNGAGKSSTLRVLAGVTRATSGLVSVDGHPMNTLKSSNKARELTGYCPDVGGLISGATPLDHVRLLASLRHDKDLYDRGVQAIQMFALNEFRNTPVSGFSHGMMRRLSVLLAYISAKRLLILDEPYDGVDPLGVDIINEAIQNAKSNGVAVLVSTHLQPLLVSVSDSINIMSKGELLDIIPADELSGLSGNTRYAKMLSDHQGVLTQ